MSKIKSEDTSATTSVAAFPTEPEKPKKRIQISIACGNCQIACKKCADERPCPRCVQRKHPETCADAVRRPRRKGLKRGPYRRRKKIPEPEPEHPSPPTNNGKYTLSTVGAAITRMLYYPFHNANLNDVPAIGASQLLSSNNNSANMTTDEYTKRQRGHDKSTITDPEHGSLSILSERRTAVVNTTVNDVVTKNKDIKIKKEEDATMGMDWTEARTNDSMKDGADHNESDSDDSSRYDTPEPFT